MPSAGTENLIIVSQKMGPKHEISKSVSEVEKPKSVKSWQPVEQDCQEEEWS